MARRRFGRGVPESNAAGVDAPALIVRGLKDSVTRAPDAPLFFSLEA